MAGGRAFRCETLPHVVDPAVLPAFLIAISVLVISPGPDLLLVSSYSSTSGFRAGACIAVGIFAAGVLQTVMVAFGLGQIMQSMPAIATAIRAIGALYLAILGVRLIVEWLRQRRVEPDAQSDLVPADSLSSRTSRQLVVRGLLNNLLNPKALLFFSVFLPQFTNSERSASLQILVLGMVLTTAAFAFNVAVAAAFSTVADRIGVASQRQAGTSRGSSARSSSDWRLAWRPTADRQRGESVPTAPAVTALA